MFTRTILFFFCFVGMFAVVFASIPGEYFASEEYESSSGIDKEVAEQLTLANVTIYDTGGQDNMTFSYTSLQDAPSAPQYLVTGTTDDFVEIWWGAESMPPYGAALEIRHARRNTIPWTWFASWKMDLSFANGSRLSPWITSSSLLEGWDETSNCSSFYGECEHASMSVSFTIHNTTRDATISDAWASGEIDYYLSYERNWNATSISALTLMGQLLSFQNPNLGVPGFMGTVMNYAIALPFWVITAIAIIKLVQSILPWIRGVED